MSVLITRIEPQKNKKNRYSLYSDKQFILGLSDESLLSFKIHSGIELSDETIKQIEEKEYLIAIKEQALRYLARRPHGCEELKKKLSRKGYNATLINRIIQEFLEKNYLNDEEFTRLFIQDEMGIKKSGPLLIKHKLITKGINTTIAQKLLYDQYPENLQLKNCQWLALKKVKTMHAIPKDKKRKQLATYLTRKGFNWDFVKTVVLDIIREEQDEEF